MDWEKHIPPNPSRRDFELAGAGRRETTRKAALATETDEGGNVEGPEKAPVPETPFESLPKPRKRRKSSSPNFSEGAAQVINRALVLATESQRSQLTTSCLFFWFRGVGFGQARH
jgi:hypothetical protein